MRDWGKMIHIDINIAYDDFDERDGWEWSLWIFEGRFDLKSDIRRNKRDVMCEVKNLMNHIPGKYEIREWIKGKRCYKTYTKETK